MIQFRRRLWDWLRELPSLGFLLVFALLTFVFIQVSVYRTVLTVPEESLVQWLPLTLRLMVVVVFLGSLRINHRDLTLTGVTLALPLADGMMAIGVMVPLLGIAGLSGLLVLGPVVLALDDRGLLESGGIIIALLGAPFITISTSWTVIVGRLGQSVGKWLFTLAYGGIVWILLNTPWLNIFTGSTRLLGGFVLLLLVDGLGVWWLVTRFHWPADRIEVQHLAPVGHQWDFPRGRLAWLSLEARLLLRDRKLLGYNLGVMVILWAILFMVKWGPNRLELGPNQSALNWERYFIPLMYAAVMLMAYGPLRARSQDLSKENWIRGLPMRVADYLIGKGTVHIVAGVGTWLLFLLGAFLIVMLSPFEIYRSILFASTFATVTYTMAFFWGCALPVEEEGSLPGLLSATLFYMASMGLFQLTSRIESLLGGMGGSTATAPVLIIIFLGLAVALEGRRRWRAF